MPDELRDAIEGTLEHTCCEDFETQATSILSLIAPILADAEKWKRFLAIQSCNDCPACPECPCDEKNCPAIKIEDAFEGEGVKG